MIFDGEEYEVLRELYRTKGSLNQLLMADSTYDNIEDRRKFYIVEKDGVKYFVKEYTDRNYGGNLGFPENINYEYETTKRLYGEITRRNGTIGVPKTFAIEDNRILFEYLDGYRRPQVHELNNIHRLVYEFLRKKDIDNYDLCPNNIMVKHELYIDNGVHQLQVRLIDFEYSADRNTRKEFGLE